MKRITLIVALFVAFLKINAQANYEKYWQQKANYDITASLNTETDILSGHEKLVYTNNSPHTLEKLYFHLYQNAFTPGSYLSEKTKNSDRPINFGHYEKQGKAMEVSSVKVNGKSVSREIDNTIMEITLNNKLKPGDSLIVEMDFKTYFDIEANWRRMRVFKAYGAKNYNGGHWYPRISVFDRKFGWTADQHLVHEFYGNFGKYNVKLKLPAHYIVDATGILQNEKQVLPDSLKKKLNLNNFKDKPLYSKPSQVISPTEEMKTWHFKARNVHDFAFIASPLFRFEDVEWNGITCRSMVMEPHAARWQDAAELTSEIIRIFSEDFGMYAYPKIIIADVRSGMEYPMLTMNSGQSPDYSYIFAHEIGHNWFFGAVGSNETYRAALDEGFTQFLTYWALDKLRKERPVESDPPDKFPLKFRNRRNLKYRTIYKNYYKDAFYSDGTRLNQHSDKFPADNPYGTVYRQTYYKTSTMLYNLQYVLGDSLFKSCMRHYYKTWKFRQPYLEDMRNAFINHSCVDLNWFFDQWLNSKKTADYAVKDIDKTSSDSFRITLQRKGRMEMPLDVKVTFRDGSSKIYHIPNRRFIKETDAIVLDKWYGWDHLNPEYRFTIESQSPVTEVIIDPKKEIPDMNRLNNSSKFKPSLQFDYLINQPENPYKYEIYARPDLWWNEYSGLQAGFSLDGTYMKELHDFNVSFLYNTGLLNNTTEGYSRKLFSWNFNYNIRISISPAKTYLDITSIRDAGWNFNSISFQYQGKSRKNTFYFGLESSYRDDFYTVNYFPQNPSWEANGFDDLYLYLRTDYKLKFHEGSLQTGITSSMGKIKNSYWDFELSKDFNLGNLTLRTRSFARYGLSSQYPVEDALLLSGANPINQMQNRLLRSPGIIPNNWKEYGISPGHFHQPGGLNLRGYTGYYSISRNKEGALEYLHKGNTGLSFNSELSFGQWMNFPPGKMNRFLNLDFYLFFDAGSLSGASISNPPAFERIYMDAGSGLLLNIKQWGHFEKIKPLSLRFDMPLFLNIKPYGDDNNFQFRWLIGIEKSI